MSGSLPFARLSEGSLTGLTGGLSFPSPPRWESPLVSLETQSCIFRLRLGICPLNVVALTMTINSLLGNYLTSVFPPEVWLLLVHCYIRGPDPWQPSATRDD